MTLLLALLVCALPAQSSDAIAVYVFTPTDPSGLRHPLQTRREDSAEDLVKALDGRRHIVLVNERARADVTLEVLNATKEESGRSTSVYLGFGIASTRKETQPTVRVELRTGDYAVTIEGVGPRWRIAADAVADAVEQWIRENAAVLAKRREQRRDS